MWVIVGCSVVMGFELSSACVVLEGERGSKFCWWGDA